ncbi:hypothetical protein RV134_340192 [Roseovarius sp. EC-HK134]|nr:hypothetical protein RV134_340192 [Roseovarius sp. EC-HK134]
MGGMPDLSVGPVTQEEPDPNATPRFPACRHAQMCNDDDTGGVGATARGAAGAGDCL